MGGSAVAGEVVTGLDMFELGYMHGYGAFAKESDDPEYLRGYQAGDADYEARVKREEQWE